MKKPFADRDLSGFDVRTLGKLVAAIIVGLSIGTLVSPEPVTFPVVGTVSGIIVGAIGLVTGAVLYTQIPGCGCSGDCGC